MSAQLEQIIAQLLVPDSNAIQAATVKLKEFSKDPAIVPALCQILSTSENNTIRQYAATILRQKIERIWSKLDNDLKNGIKTICLQVLQSQVTKEVRNSVTAVICVITKHEFSSWPELLNFITAACYSDNLPAKELGLYMLGVVSESVGVEMEPHFNSMFELYANCLSHHNQPEVLHLTCVAMSQLVPYLGSNHAQKFGVLLPNAINAIQILLGVDEDKACTSFELFDSLLECEVAIIVPHLTSLLTLCLEVTKNTAFDDGTRVKFMTFLSWLVSTKKKALQKLQLVTTILDVILPLMACPDIDEDEDTSQNPGSFAGSVLDTLALHLPSDKLVPILYKNYILPLMSSGQPLERKAGLTALAVVAEGTCEYMLEHMMQDCLKLAGNGLSDEAPEVRNAALYALGQFAEHFQPDIVKYSNEILPILCQKIAEEMSTQSAALTRTYYALESFCENMGENIVPYLPDLVEKLVVMIAHSPTVHGKELAISALGAVSNAAEEAIVPFLGQVMEHLKVYLTAPDTEDGIRLKTQAIDTLSVFARKIGKETFSPMAAECVQLGIANLSSADDPDLRRCIYSLFAAISSTCPEALYPCLDPIVKKMFETLESTEGMTTEYKNDAMPRFDLDDSIEEGKGEESDDEDEVLGDYESIEGILVENGYLEEKGDALTSLCELADNMATHFVPYYEETFGHGLKLVDYNAPMVRRGSILCMTHVCVSLHKVIQQNNFQDESAMLPKFLAVCVPLVFDVARSDKDREIVCCALECINEMLKEMKGGLIAEEEYFDSLIEIVKDVLQHKTACQKDSEDETFCDDVEDDSELTTVLVDFAGSILPSLATAMGGQRFTPYFKNFLPLIIPKEGRKRSERSLAAGTLAEICQAMKESIIPFSDNMYSVFMRGIKDNSEEVISNSVFGLGVLIESSGPTLAPRYPEILGILSTFLKQDGDRRTIDNVLGAVARMMKTNPGSLPLDTIFPTFVKWLPLQEDYEENITVYSSIYGLLSSNCQVAIEQLPTLIPLMITQLTNKKVDDETKAKLTEILQGVTSQYQDLTLKSITSDQAEILKQALAHVNGS
ncbi:importin-4-like [Bolinopsis microptera]|uniref:importin-4-like n=1 Tax=Bolinopsis microptera TaxID=2820187 RepID=UPI003078C5B3